jgi:hypothetical protein
MDKTMEITSMDDLKEDGTYYLIDITTNKFKFRDRYTPREIIADTSLGLVKYSIYTVLIVGVVLFGISSGILGFFNSSSAPKDYTIPEIAMPSRMYIIFLMKDKAPVLKYYCNLSSSDTTLHHIDIRNKFNQYIDAEIVMEPMRKLLLSINNNKFMESLEISIKQDFLVEEKIDHLLSLSSDVSPKYPSLFRKLTRHKTKRVDLCNHINALSRYLNTPVLIRPIAGFTLKRKYHVSYNQTLYKS